MNMFDCCADFPNSKLWAEQSNRCMVSCCFLCAKKNLDLSVACCWALGCPTATERHSESHNLVWNRMSWKLYLQSALEIFDLKIATWLHRPDQPTNGQYWCDILHFQVFPFPRETIYFRRCRSTPNISLNMLELFHCQKKGAFSKTQLRWNHGGHGGCSLAGLAGT